MVSMTFQHMTAAVTVTHTVFLNSRRSFFVDSYKGMSEVHPHQGRDRPPNQPLVPWKLLSAKCMSTGVTPQAREVLGAIICISPISPEMSVV